MWTHFETIHVSMVPTYMSMYFPGQGLVLAAGKVLFGNPWFGQSDDERADVRRDLLDAAGVASAIVGTAGRNTGSDPLGLFSYWVNYLHRRRR